MARIRTIKPEFWTSEKVVECSPTARLMFVGLWNFADDGGVLPDSWKRIKMQVFPGDSFSQGDIESMVDELLSNGLLNRFYVEDQAFLLIKGWNHQKIDKPSYKYPQPDEDTEFDNRSTTVRRPFDGCPPADRKGEDSTGEEGSGKEMSVQSNGRSSSYPDDFEQFWKVYPSVRKTKKGDALTAWKKAIKLTDADTLTAKAAEYAASEVGSGQFSVMPSVWLNGRCWEDDPATWNPKRQPAAMSTKTQRTLAALQEFVANG